MKDKPNSWTDIVTGVIQEYAAKGRPLDTHQAHAIACTRYKDENAKLRVGVRWENIPAKPTPTGQQTYSAPRAVKPSPFARIRQLLGFKETKQSGKARCTGCGDAVQLQANTHQFYRGDQPLCERCAGPVGVQLAQLYSVVVQNPAQQYTVPSGSVSAVK